MSNPVTNAYLLELAGQAENILLQIQGHQTPGYDISEALAAVLFGALEVLAGGTPSRTILAETGPAGVTDAVIMRPPSGRFTVPACVPPRPIIGYSVRLRLTDSSFTPGGPGSATSSVFEIPYDPQTGNSVNWTVTRLDVRNETPGSSSTIARFELSAGGGAWNSLGYIDPSGLTLSNAAYQASLTSGFSIPVLTSGQLVRLNVTQNGSPTGLSSYITLAQES